MRKKPNKTVVSGKDRFCQQDLDRLHEVAREVFQMGTMRGTATLVESTDELEGAVGICYPNFARNMYRIKIANPDYIKEPDNDVLDTLFHEIAHAKYWYLTKLDLTKVEQEHHEYMINDIAGIMVRLYRGQK